MKSPFRFLLILHMAFFTLQLSFAQERGMKPVQVIIDGVPATLYAQSHALLIGVSAYTAGLPPLPGVVGDINTVKGALETGGFNVVTVMNPDHMGLQKAFTSFIAKYGQGAGNRLLIYYAGHGYTEKMPYGDDIGYICPVDAPDPNKNPAGFQEKAMPMRQIETYAYQIKSKHALFLFDACFSGSIFSTSRAIPEVISYKTKEAVRQFITSGSANETVPDKSIFKDQFVRALKGEADGNKDGYLTGTELGEFLQSTVVNYSYGSQHPQYGKIRNANLDKGDFVFVLKPASATTNTPVPTPSAPAIEEERTLIQYGKLDLTTEIAGSLYIDGTYMKQLNANTALTLNNLSEGTHKVKISGDETVEKEVIIKPNQTASVTIDKQKTQTATQACPGMPTFTDPRDNQVYPTVQIGDQCWMQNNMNFQTGNSWCYENNSSNCTTYGRLYDWETALKVCPNGWHLPSDAEWQKLVDYLGGDAAGGKMKETGTNHWESPNKGATNSSGFTALPGGTRHYNGGFYNLTGYAYFWSSTEGSSTNAWRRNLGCNDEHVIRGYGSKTNGFSCRCLKN